MNAPNFYNNIHTIYLEHTCVEVSIRKWEELMSGHVRADKNKIDGLVKAHIPELYNNLSLNLYNPYDYYRTSTHLILVHSGIEYFIKIN